MFNFKFIQLFSVSIKHTFYDNSISKDFNIIPLPNTATLLQKYGLVARMTNGIFIVYQRLDASGEIFQPIDDEVNLFFTVYLNTDILNITENFGQGKYWFSNLKSDGNYNEKLTKYSMLSSDDIVTNISGQLIRINFPRRSLTNIQIKRITSGKGLEVIESYEIDDEIYFQDVQINLPGKYIIQKLLKSGVKESADWIIHDDLIRAKNYWGVIHLQLVPLVENRVYTIDLKPKKSIWQYLLIEPKTRNGLPLIGEDLHLIY